MSGGQGLCFAMLLAALPVRAMNSEELGTAIGYGTLLEGALAGVSYASSGASSSGSDRLNAPRLVGAAEFAGAVTFFLYEYFHGGKPHWIGPSALAALGAYNLLTRGGIEWRIVGNEIGLHAAIVGSYFDLRHDGPQPQPGFAFTGNSVAFSTRW